MGARVAVRGPLMDAATGDPVGSAFWDCVAMTRIVLEQPEGHMVLHGPAPAGRR